MIPFEESDWGNLCEKRKQHNTRESFDGWFRASSGSYRQLKGSVCMSLISYHLLDSHCRRCSSRIKLYIVTHFPSSNNTNSLLAPHPTAQIRLEQLSCSTKHHYVYFETQLALHQAQLQPLRSKEGVESVIILGLHISRRMSASMLDWQRSCDAAVASVDISSIRVWCIVLGSRCEV